MLSVLLEGGKLTGKNNRTGRKEAQNNGKPAFITQVRAFALFFQGVCACVYKQCAVVLPDVLEST